MATIGEEYVNTAHDLTAGDQEANNALYNEWSGSYDAHLATMDYLSPKATVDAVVANIKGDSKLKILDAGCGTGLVGASIASNSTLSGRFELDGIDISTGMLDEARKKGIYSKLEVGDLSRRLQFADATYDVVVCTGTLTMGHVGPEALEELVRISKSGGVVAATVYGKIWESHGYKSAAEALSTKGLAEVVSTDEFAIVEGGARGGIMLVLRKK